MRIPVVDQNGTPLMPCTPVKARLLIKRRRARPKRNKLGLFYIQLTYTLEQPANQPLAVGIDPGSFYEGYCVVGTQETVLNLMSEAPTHVKEAVKLRRSMRRARRFRKCRRRAARFTNRLAREQRIPPSTRSRWERKAQIVRHLSTILPLTDAVVEDVQATLRKGKGGRWNTSFSPAQVGKQHLYRLLSGMGLRLHLRKGWQTKALREQYGQKKVKAKSKRVFTSHAVDAWVLAASVSGAWKPTCTRLWYVSAIRLNRRQLHMLQYSKGGIRRAQGGTRSLGLKRGTLVKHAKYGLCSVGGFERRKQRISLHNYRTNKRLTQGAKVVDCGVLTWTPYRTYLVSAAL